ncbi:preprotein translocase SecA [Streptomyces spiroverticillatus]|uniref:Preprotein translocase SecA n=1 Tax=Streptomyces finlayi TaxID=67296 RepID=A0A918WY60_9ACTN|nr:SEC-C metal-binding domain-containing protein [Streptomyces finlayi]GGZ91075.1 preprotein translocase SecA [Streptomyces spiroverticillatus]GHC94094.1 preprotein translocase SecA [Streptomyces finlayi]
MASKRSRGSTRHRSKNTNTHVVGDAGGEKRSTGPDYAQWARDFEADAERFPEQREEILEEAAQAWKDAKEFDRAIEVYDRLLDPEGPPVEDADLVRAYRIATLWEAGRPEEARAGMAELRRRHPKSVDAWEYGGEALEEYDSAESAADWYTAALSHLLGAGAPTTADTIEARAPGIASLFVARHRVRRATGAAHDDWDDLAHTFHDRRGGFFGANGIHRPLDDLHDPVRGRQVQDEMYEEAIAAQLAEHAPAGTVSAGAVYWPAAEFSRLLAAWPQAATSFGESHGGDGADHAAHRRDAEDSLRARADAGTFRLGVVHAGLDGLTDHAARTGRSPGDPATRAAYEAELARTTEPMAWPPPRNAPCWCGEDRKYKKCCGNPANG